MMKGIARNLGLLPSKKHFLGNKHLPLNKKSSSHSRHGELFVCSIDRSNNRCLLHCLWFRYIHQLANGWGKLQMRNCLTSITFPLRIRANYI